VEEPVRYRPIDGLGGERSRGDARGLATTKPLVLVIIHDAWMRQFIDWTLRSHGYRVLTASNGITGLRLARCEQPIVVMLEMALPELSGAQVIEELQATAETAGVIVVRPGDDPDSADPGIRPHFDGELPRRFDVVDLIDRVDWVSAKRRIGRAGVGVSRRLRRHERGYRPRQVMLDLPDSHQAADCVQHPRQVFGQHRPLSRTRLSRVATNRRQGGRTSRRRHRRTQRASFASGVDQ